MILGQERVIWGEEGVNLGENGAIWCKKGRFGGQGPDFGLRKGDSGAKTGELGGKGGAGGVRGADIWGETGPVWGGGRCLTLVAQPQEGGSLARPLGEQLQQEGAGGAEDPAPRDVVQIRIVEEGRPPIRPPPDGKPAKIRTNQWESGG